ncbi:MAG TPA: enoyl-CoA hydratase-related protein [Solirubrobacteraceae bacterium]|jgi:2-(1,2-epoxy-1,2-dihydrophenyl)acetyl-CoA isomerase|nr:enoyl-CoA hydratase-related protein [Solirubrobacteraceae bacterium]
MVELVVEDALATITLASPATRNAIVPDWVQALEAAVTACALRTDVRALLFRADGPAFTIGGDLAHFAGAGDRLADELEEMVSRYHATLVHVAELPLPVVCAARGAVAGGGLGLLWAADIVLLAHDARLVTGVARLGLSGDGGSSWYLPRLVGLHRAAELLIEGRALDAETALVWGLANRVLPGTELDGAAHELARSLADGPTRAYAEMRRLLRGALDVELRTGLDSEREANVRCGATADGREGVAAFAERRPPRFTGA